MTTQMRPGLLALGALALAAATAPSALAVPPGSAVCADHDFTPVFTEFGDRGLYTLVPGGDFESEAHLWQGGVRVPDGSAHLGGDDAWSLRLAPGATAVSPEMCVTRAYRWLRLIATSPTREGRLRVRVEYPTTTRTEATIVAAVPSPLTRRVDLDARLIGHPRAAQEATVRIEVTAVRGAWTVDDVYADPRMR